MEDNMTKFMRERKAPLWLWQIAADPDQIVARLQIAIGTWGVISRVKGGDLQPKPGDQLIQRKSLGLPGWPDVAIALAQIASCQRGQRAGLLFHRWRLSPRNSFFASRPSSRPAISWRPQVESEGGRKRRSTGSAALYHARPRWPTSDEAESIEPKDDRCPSEGQRSRGPARPNQG